MVPLIQSDEALHFLHRISTIQSDFTDALRQPAAAGSTVAVDNCKRLTVLMWGSQG
jgi:hypothetical protein